MRDVMHKELNMDDLVVFSDGRYADLYRGVVIGFTPKMVRIRFQGSNSTTLKSPNQVAIVEKRND